VKRTVETMDTAGSSRMKTETKKEERFGWIPREHTLREACRK
jgi:hypothetical protein